MRTVLLQWDDAVQRAVEVSIDNPTTVTGLPKSPLNAQWNQRGWWEELQKGAFASIVGLDLSGTRGLVDIKDASFAFLPNLRAVYLNPETRSIGASAFKGCSSLTGIDIPSGVTSIGPGAFMGCTSLKDISIPTGVRSIHENAFYGCTALKGINIPSGVTQIGPCAFCGCARLKRINIPSGVTQFGNYAFCGCTRLRGINVPSGVTSIASCAFQCCSSLRSISLPNGVTLIGVCAFHDCSSLVGINIPGGVKSIAWNAFLGCSLEVVLLEDPKSSALEGLPPARRFLANCVDARSLSGAQGVDVVSIGGKKLCAPVEDDWRFLERLDKCPLEE